MLPLARLAVAAVCVLALGGGCKAERETAVAADATPERQVALTDGKHFGYIDSVDLDALTVRLDVAEFLLGDEADRAAQEDGVVEPGAQVENDYYIRNDDETYQQARLAEDVKIRVVGDPPETIPGELEPFAEGFTKDNVAFDPSDPYRGGNTQYWVTVRNHVIVEIEELYLP